MVKMKAVFVEEYDNNDTGKMIYGELDRPTPKDDEVLIQIAGASFNPADRQVSAGEYKDFYPTPLPYIPGMDGAGVVAEVGKNVKNVKVGDRVMSYLGYAAGGGGGEYTVTKGDNVSPAPKNIPLSLAGTIPGGATTAWEALFDNGKLEEGQTVVINGASGGVGIYLIQLAKWKGAKVIAVDAAEQEEIVKDLGADVFVDFRTEKAENIIDEKVDLIINFSNAPNSQIEGQMTKLKKNGIVVNGNAASAQDSFKKAGQKNDEYTGGVVFESDEETEEDYEYIVFAVSSNTPALNKISELVEEEVIKLYVSEKVELKDLKEAHDMYLRGENVGKIAVIVNDEI